MFGGAAVLPAELSASVIDGGLRRLMKQEDVPPRSAAATLQTIEACSPSDTCG